MYNKDYANMKQLDLFEDQAFDSAESKSTVLQMKNTATNDAEKPAFAATENNPSSIALAYFGGFFDGEGCIHLAKQTFRDPNRRATFRMRVDLSQNNLEILQAFEREVGVPGSLHALKRTLSQNRQCYKILYDGDSAFEVLRRLLPYLRRKRPEAIVALEYQQSCAIHIHPGRRGIDPNDWALRARFYRKLRAMK